MSSLLTRALLAWPFGHAHPVLRAELNRAESGTDDHLNALIDALLEDLAHPVESAPEAVRLMIRQGRFAQAVRQIEELEPGTVREELERECVRARRAASLRLDRRRSELANRARRVGTSGRDVDVRLEDRSTVEVEGLLDDWERELRQAEKDRREGLEAELGNVANPADHPEWILSVDACIKKGDFPTARLLLSAGPTGDPKERTPAAIPLMVRWPWPGTPIETALGWYESGHTAGFNDRWKPRDSDTTATALLTALRALHRRVDADAVRALTAALDRLLDTGGTAGPVHSVAEAFCTSLGGLSHAGLPKLELPAQMDFWVARSDWRPPPDGQRPAVWFIPDTGTLHVDRPGGIAILTPETLFRLLTVPAPSARRLNLLREIYRQLEFDDLLSPGHGFQIGRSASLHTDLAWTLDLLGVTPETGVLDVLLYDVGEHPRALRAALKALIGGIPRLPILSRAEVSAWRADPEARAALREQVISGLDEAPIAVLMTLLVWTSGAGETFTYEDIAEMLRTLEEEADGYHSQPTAGIELDAVLAQLVTRDLLREADGRYQFPSSGLAGLLGDDQDECREQALAALRALRDRRKVILESLCQSLSSDTLRHLSKNHISGLREMLSKLRDVSVEPEPDLREIREDIEAALQQVNELLQSSELITEEEAEKWMVPAEFDLTELLTEITQSASVGRTQRIVYDPPRPFRVQLSRQVAKIALRNLIDNAVQATAKVSPSGEIRVALTAKGMAPKRHILIDIEDSGPGFPAEVLDSGGSKPISQKPGRGLGIFHARVHIDHCGGRMRLQPQRSGDLGGAHVQVQLPLASPEE